MGVFIPVIKKAQDNNKIEKAILEMLVFEDSRLNWQSMRQRRRLLWKF